MDEVNIFTSTIVTGTDIFFVRQSEPVRFFRFWCACDPKATLEEIVPAYASFKAFKEITPDSYGLSTDAEKFEAWKNLKSFEFSKKIAEKPEIDTVPSTCIPPECIRDGHATCNNPKICDNPGSCSECEYFKDGSPGSCFDDAPNENLPWLTGKCDGCEYNHNGECVYCIQGVEWVRPSYIQGVEWVRPSYIQEDYCRESGCKYYKDGSCICCIKHDDENATKSKEKE